MSKTPEAHALQRRAVRVMSGGVSAAGRFNPVLGRPHYFVRGEGSRLWDVDGYEFLDYSSSNGASLLGHGDPRIVRAVKRGLQAGTICTQETAWHVELAERLCSILPGCERVRLSNTGTEATMAALRVARAATGRERVLKFDGHFHGMHDQLLFNHHTPPDSSEGSEAPPFPDSAGIPPAVGAMLVTVPFNDTKALLKAFDRHGDDLACVILEPVAYNMGCVPAEPDWLALLRAETTRRGIVLIFDEVLSGFRMGLGGGAEHFGVEPDLATWAKALAGGWPLAALTGRASVMDELAPAGGVIVSGTYTGQLCAVLASLATLDAMAEHDFYERLNRTAEMLVNGLGGLFERHSVPGHVRGLGARFGLYFGLDAPVRNYREAQRFDADLNNVFLTACVKAGLHFHDFGARCAPMHYGTTAAHTHDDVVLTLERLDLVFDSLAQRAA